MGKMVGFCDGDEYYADECPSCGRMREIDCLGFMPKVSPKIVYPGGTKRARCPLFVAWGSTRHLPVKIPADDLVSYVRGKE